MPEKGNKKQLRLVAKQKKIQVRSTGDHVIRSLWQRIEEMSADDVRQPLEPVLASDKQLGVVEDHFIRGLHTVLMDLRADILANESVASRDRTVEQREYHLAENRRLGLTINALDTLLAGALDEHFDTWSAPQRVTLRIGWVAVLRGDDGSDDVKSASGGDNSGAESGN